MEKDKIIKELRKLYIKKSRVAIINKELSIELDNKIEEFIGGNIDSFEMDFAVDTLNEGYGNLSFENFIKELRKLKIKSRKDEHN